jgi:replication factor A2
MICNKASRATDVTFTLDDGTGRMDFIRWLTLLALSFLSLIMQNLTVIFDTLIRETLCMAEF